MDSDRCRRHRCRHPCASTGGRCASEPAGGAANHPLAVTPALGVLLLTIGLLVGALAGYFTGDSHSPPAATTPDGVLACRCDRHPRQPHGHPLLGDHSEITLAVVSVSLRPAVRGTRPLPVDSQVTSCAPTSYVSNPTVPVTGPTAAKLSAIIRTERSAGSMDVAWLVGSDTTSPPTSAAESSVSSTLSDPVPSTLASTDPTTVTLPPMTTELQTATGPSTYEPQVATTKPSANGYSPPITPTRP